jgi:hypothetical protein
MIGSFMCHLFWNARFDLMSSMSEWARLVLLLLIILGILASLFPDFRFDSDGGFCIRRFFGWKRIDPTGMSLFVKTVWWFRIYVVHRSSGSGVIGGVFVLQPILMPRGNELLARIDAMMKR